MVETVDKLQDELSRIKKQLRKSKSDLSKFRAVVDNSYDAISTIDANRTITFCNDAFAGIFGYSVKELIGRSFRMLHVDEEHFHAFGRTVYPLNTVKGFWKGEWEYRKKDRSIICMETVVSHLWRSRKLTVGYIVAMRDVTQRKEAERALLESETRFRQLFENIRSGVAIYEAVDSGEDFLFRDVNRAAERIDKLRGESIIGQRLTDVFPSVGEFGLLGVMQRVYATGRPQGHPIALYKDERIEGWRENYVYKLPTGEVVVVYDDVTDMKTAEDNLRQSEGNLREIVNAVHAGIVIIDPENHRIVEANPKALKIIGAEAGRVVGNVCHQFICPAEAGKCPVTDLGQVEDNSERILRTIDGRQIPILKNVSRILLHGKDHLIESFIDISELKELQKHLQELATTDSLTGTNNRRHFIELSSKELSRSQRYGIPLSMIIFDIDHFKAINDTCGHSAGDEMLREISSICLRGLRENDIPGRIGGEEFAITTVECDLPGATIIAERLRKDIEELSVRCDDREMRCTISLGVAQLRPGEDLDPLMKRADVALYSAKNSGRNRVCAGT